MCKRLILGTVISSIAAAGCGVLPTDKLYTDYGVGTLKFDSDTAASKLQQAIEANKLIDKACFEVPVAAVHAAVCKQQRNATVAVLLNASDDMCQAHLRTIFGNEAAFNIATGTIATLTSGAAAIAGSPAGKSALSAVSAFSNAERSLVNETVYKNMLVTAVTKKIREARQSKVAAMIPGNFSKDMDQYPMYLAIRDVIDYHYTCSFMFGLERALEEGTQPKRDAQIARLTQEQRTLELYMDSRTAALKSASGGDTTVVDRDPGITGAKKRINAIQEQLLNLEKATP